MLRRSLLLLFALTLISCSSDSTPDPITPGGPTVATLSLPLATTTAGNTYAIADLADLDLPTRGEITATIGGEPATVMIREDGTHLLGVPLFLDETTLWSVPPTTPVRVEVFEDDELIATSAAELTVSPMAEAPGATQAIVADIAAWLDDLENAFADIPMEPGAGEIYSQALFPALRQIIDLHPEHSLQSMLDDLTTEERKLMDAMSHSVGMDRAMDDLAQAFDEITNDGGSGPQKNPGKAAPCGIQIDDYKLAAFMQFGSFAGEFSSNFIAGMAADFSGFNNGAGLVLIADIGQKVPILGEALGVINIILGFVDLFLNNIVVGMMPTRIESITLEIEDTNISIDEVTESVMTICARNQPPGVTINDIVAQIINFSALVSPGGPGDVRVAVEAIVLFVLEQINNAISAYIGANPGLEVSTTIFSVPTMRWSTQIQDEKLINRLSTQPSIVEVLENETEWRGLEVGTASVQFYPSTDPSSIIIPGYIGGAFGADGSASNPVELNVNGLVLAVDMAESVSANGILALGAKAGHYEDGEIVYGPFISVVLEIDGGTGDPGGGSTDDDGDFISLITPDEGADMIEVRVTATDADGNEAKKTVSAVVERTKVVLEHRSSLVAGTITKTGVDYADTLCHERNLNDSQLPGSWSGTASASCAAISMTASQSSVVQSRDEFPNLLSLLAIDGTGSVQMGGPPATSERWDCSSSLAVQFRVVNGPARLHGTYTLDFPGNGNDRGELLLYDPQTKEYLVESRFPIQNHAIDMVLPPSPEPYSLIIRTRNFDAVSNWVDPTPANFQINMKLDEVTNAP